MRPFAHPRGLVPAVTLGAAVLLACALTVAQPRGPRDVITGAKAEQVQREMRSAAAKGASTSPPPAMPPAPTTPTTPATPTTPTAPAAQAAPGAAPPLPAGHPPTAPDGPASAGQATPAQPSPHAAIPGNRPAERKPLSESRVDPSLPKGTIRVRVLDHLEQPVVGQSVRIGIMSGDGGREALNNPTGADGYATFGGLEAGTNKAYRASLMHEGAKYGANPFRLEPGAGQEITIRRLPVTHDDRMLVLYVGAASVELKDERVKVVQQARLLNIGEETYAFPEEGTLIGLPEGFMAFQAQDSMTDQHLEEAPGEGVRVTGSVPPGEVSLMWGFDLPLIGTEAEFAVDLPWLTFAYRVVSDAPKGLKLSVTGMPEPEVHSDEGRRFLVTSVQRKVGEEPFRRLHVRLSGIPGPGPFRWIAAGLAIFAIAAGFLFARRVPKSGSHTDGLADQAAHKAELLARAARLRAERDDEAIGPEYYAEQRRRIEDELAELIFIEERLAGS